MSLCIATPFFILLYGTYSIFIFIVYLSTNLLIEWHLQENMNVVLSTDLSHLEQDLAQVFYT